MKKFQTPEEALAWAYDQRELEPTNSAAWIEIADAIDWAIREDESLYTVEYMEEVVKALSTATCWDHERDVFLLIVNRLGQLLKEVGEGLSVEAAEFVTMAYFHGAVEMPDSSECESWADRIFELMSRADRYGTGETGVDFASALFNAAYSCHDVNEILRMAKRIESLLSSDARYKTPEIAHEFVRSLARAADLQPDFSELEELACRIKDLMLSDEAFGTNENVCGLTRVRWLAAEASDDSEFVERVANWAERMVLSTGASVDPEIAVYALRVLQRRIEIVPVHEEREPIVDRAERVFRVVAGPEATDAAEAYANACHSATVSGGSTQLCERIAERIDKLYWERREYRTEDIAEAHAAALFHVTCGDTELGSAKRAVAKLERLFWEEDAYATPAAGWELAKAIWNLCSSFDFDATDLGRAGGRALQLVERAESFRTPELVFEAALFHWKASCETSDDQECERLGRRAVEIAALADGRFSMPALDLLVALVTVQAEADELATERLLSELSPRSINTPASDRARFRALLQFTEAYDPAYGWTRAVFALHERLSED